MAKLQSIHLPRQTLLQPRETALLSLIVLLTLGVSCVDPAFLRWDNLRDILVRAAPTAIVACGVMLVVITGEIDISVGALMATLAAVLGVLLSEDHMALPTPVGLVFVLTLGTLLGTVTGWLVTWGQVPSILATLGLLTAWRGITMIIMAGHNIDGLPAALTQGAKYGWAGLPWGIWAASAVIVLTGLLLHYSPWGAQWYALGSSPQAAHLVGLPTRQLITTTFAYTGFLTAVATLIEVPRLPKIEAGIGQGFELTVITCVVVGGVSVTGGRGRLRGVLLAVLLLTMLRPALTFLAIGESGEKWTKAIQGGLILASVITDSVRRQPQGRSAT